MKKGNPSSLLVRMLGLYVISTANSHTNYLIMENVLSCDAIYEIYDLKGLGVEEKKKKKKN